MDVYKLMMASGAILAAIVAALWPRGGPQLVRYPVAIDPHPREIPRVSSYGVLGENYSLGARSSPAAAAPTAERGVVIDSAAGSFLLNVEP